MTKTVLFQQNIASLTINNLLKAYNTYTENVINR